MPDIEASQRDKLLANAAAIADANTNLQQQQQALQTIGSMMTQVFDQVGQAITNSFVNGTGAAVNWGNVTRSVIASVVQEVLKLAILNPILNSVTGSSLTTLSGAASAVAGSSGGSSALSSGGSVLSTGSSLYSAYNGLFGNTGLLTSGGMLSTSSTGGFLGLTGAGGSLTGAGGILYSGMGAESAAMASAPLAAGESGVVLPGATASSGAGLLGGTAASTAVGGAAGIGIGYLGGSLIGGSIAASHNTVPLGSEIGAGAGAVGGAVAGAAIGSVVPVIGTAIGALIGGIVGGIGGGAGGGLIGPHIASAYSSTEIGLNNGLLATGASVSQKDASNTASTVADAQTINAFLSANGLSISSMGGISQIGDNTPGGYQDPSKSENLATAFTGFRFASNDSTFNSFLSGKSFDLTTLETDVAEYENLVNTTIPALTKQTTVTGSLNDAITSINAAYDPAITAAQKYGVATDALTASQTAAIQAANDAAAAQTAATDTSLNDRYYKAAATISGNPADTLNEQLYAFDQAAPGQVAALKAQLDATYGTAFETSSAYADQMAALERTLGEERLAIQQAYNDKLAATATQGVTSLESYVLKLQTGSTSPLSPSAQYKMASSQFNAVAGAAQAGDYNSYTSLSSYADTFLASSQTMNGTGSAYTADFNKVLDTLTSLAQVTPDTLTASVYMTETQTQTQQLVAALAQIKTSVDALKQAVNAPSRLTTTQ
jgi:hypothetical protein